MILIIPLFGHLLTSILILAVPNLPRRELLFGVVVPVDFRSSPEGRRAIRIFRCVVAVPAIAGLIAIALWGSRSVPVVTSMAAIGTSLAGALTFVAMNRKFKSFAVQPQSVRVFELNTGPERLPWFTWLGLVPLLIVLAAALYLHANWDSIPPRYPVHWDIHGTPNSWADRSVQSVYGALAFGAEMAAWFFGFALALWYGSRQSEPLRRPMVGFSVTVGWSFALMMEGVALGRVIHLPVGVVAVAWLPILLGAGYLIKKSNEPRDPDPTPDECWKSGMVYYNPNDAALFVARRYGVGLTSNKANPWSWVMLASIPVLIATGFLLNRLL